MAFDAAKAAVGKKRQIVGSEGIRAAANLVPKAEKDALREKKKQEAIHARNEMKRMRQGGRKKRKFKNIWDKGGRIANCLDFWLHRTRTFANTNRGYTQLTEKSSKAMAREIAVS